MIRKRFTNAFHGWAPMCLVTNQGPENKIEMETLPAPLQLVDVSDLITQRIGRKKEPSEFFSCVMVTDRSS